MRMNVATVVMGKRLKPDYVMLVRTPNAVYTIDVNRNWYNGIGRKDAESFAKSYLARNFKKVVLVDNKEYRRRK